MAIQKENVSIDVQDIIELLHSGYTWFKKDDLGYGSIETKYNANPNQIAAIRKHPALKDAETSITIFNIIDDTKNENTTSTKGSSSNRSNNTVEREVAVLDGNITRVDAPANEAADIFANL